ncbi:MAG: pilus assembly protein [Chloroflexi bacterium]|nr:pilus assembly protein [Chloroflexota bacterium]
MNTEKKPGIFKQKGQSLVELAVGFTFLLFLLGGIVDLGRTFFTYMGLRDAAQEGAIYGSYSPRDTAGIISRAQAASPDAASTVVTVTAPKTWAGNPITVTVTYKNFEFVMPLTSAIVAQFDLSGSITDTILYPSTP